MTKTGPSLNYFDWYKAIKSADTSGDEERLISLIVRAEAFFDDEYDRSVGMFKYGEKLLEVIKNNMTWYFYYNGLHTQLELLNDYFLKKDKQIRGRILSDWDKNPPTNFSLSKADKSNLLEDHPEVKVIGVYIDTWGPLYKKYSKIVLSINNVGFQITNATKLHQAGQQEAIL
jgi:hypothetical protein